MPVDASIPLQVQQPMSPLDAYAKALSVKELMANSQLKQMQVQQGMKTLKDQQELARAWADKSNINPETGMLDPAKVKDLFSNPELYGQVVERHTDALFKKQKALREGQLASSQTLKNQEEAVHDLREQAIADYQTQLDQDPKNRQLAVEKFNQSISEGAKRLTETGVMGKGWAPPANLTPEMAIKQSMSYKERLAAEEKAKSDERAYKELSERERHDAAIERHAAAVEERLGGGAPSGDGDAALPRGVKGDLLQDVNTGAKYAIDKKRGVGYKLGEDNKWQKVSLNDIPANAQKFGSGSPAMGNRETVFTNRVLTSAEEAAADLSNVVKLPMTASRGLFGGRTQGEGIMAAGKETLANAMTTQEVQSYNVLSAGFQRSLAAIEAAGLAPSGFLSHQMDAVTFKEGDTNFTKLQKLAQTRQIVEAGLRPLANNPRLPEQQRGEIKKIVDNITQSVPFTQSDLIELHQEQAKDPKATLASVMKKMEKGGSGADAEAVAWAKANPNDPRSKKILEHNNAL